MNIIEQFLKKYNLIDDNLKNYSEEIINKNIQIINGNIRELYDSNIVLNYAGLYYQFLINCIAIQLFFYIQIIF